MAVIHNSIRSSTNGAIRSSVNGEPVEPPIPPVLLTPIYHWDETGHTSAVPPAIDSWTDKLQGLELLKIGAGLLSQTTVNGLAAIESFTDGGLQTAVSLNIPTDFSVIIVIGMTRYSLSDFSFATDSFSGTARVTLGVSQDNIITASNGFGTVLFDVLKPNVDDKIYCYAMTAKAAGNFITYQNDERIVEINSASSWAFGSIFANAGGAANRGNNGTVCEMIIYDDVLSAEQRASIIDSLRAKWGLFYYNQQHYNPVHYG